MVSFQCENCGDVLTKKKLDPHRGRCRGATFSCIDCMVHFYGTDYRSHTSCMTEDQKYQGALYKDNNKNKNKKARFNPPNSAEQESNNLFHPTPTPAAAAHKMAAVAHLPHAYVEDVPEIESYLVPDDDDNASRSDDDAPPHAPTPPHVPDAEGAVNVFDFLDTSATPNASNLALPQGVNPQNVRYDYDDNDVNAYLEANNEYAVAGKQQLVHYDAAASMAATNAVQFQTPAPANRERERERERERKKKSDKEAKDKKRKRLFLEINDQVMTDAPPVLHSGLTGGLSRMSTKRGDFPPSPASADTPASPLKKTKSSKHKSKRHSSDSAPATSNGLFSILTAGSKKSKKRKDRRSSSPSGEKKKHRSSRHKDSKDSKDSKDKKDAPKLLEYHPAEKKDDSTAAAAGQMIVYKPRADLFLSFVNKGPESDRGCSMNKALKRFHRERSASGKSLAKPAEEKELFRSLRLRKNDRGEIVIFCVDDDE
ncbi:lyar-type c2hc zinc finger protein [Ophiostoma piceae UAMH 11346]|uniref:Lyar-type c2hc zinc finger protein n=1 Tax=Ophiostoma piceae (strain UAMH 11346) TaxID=1262450 RepID=S3CJZ8_OPHP1|nr:lyar-type c2hc zinc finger protein [Ophiostoma piceae UAMH 11346]